MSLFQENYMDKWVLGKSFFEIYYMVFDQSPREVFGLDYIRIGINRINITNDIEIYKPVDKRADILVVVYTSFAISLILLIYLVMTFLKLLNLNKEKKEVIEIIKNFEIDVSPTADFLRSIVW